MNAAQTTNKKIDSDGQPSLETIVVQELLDFLSDVLAEIFINEVNEDKKCV